MFVVLGVTGNTGSVVASSLLDAGKRVRVVVRDAEKAKAFASRGAEVVVATLDDEAALTRAFEGVEGAYVLSPPDARSNDFLRESKARIGGVARAVSAAKVPHVVFLSSEGAQHETGTGPIRSVAEGERALRATSVPVTFVRAAYFVENWAAVLGAAKSDGVLPTFLAANTRIPQVSAKDIGAVAARALLEGPRGERIIELSGPEDASPDDVAALLSKLLNRPVASAVAPLEAVVPTFTQFGISHDVASLYREMYEGIASGRVGFQGGQAEAVRGNTPMEETLRALLAAT